MLLKLPLDIEVNPANRYIRTENACVAEYQKTTTQRPKHIFFTEHTIILVIRGSKLFRLGDESLEVPEGNAIFLPRGCYLVCESLEHDHRYESAVLFFHEKLIRDFWARNQGYLAGHDDACPEPLLVIPFTEELVGFKDSLLGYFSMQHPLLEALIRHKLEELLLLLLASGQRRKVTRFLRQICAEARPDLAYVVTQHLFSPLTLDDLARLSGRSLSGFKREFGTRFGDAPKQWITRQRLAQARLLLHHSAQSVAEVCYACGFEDPSHFTRLYKKQFGCTPSAHLSQTAGHLD